MLKFLATLALLASIATSIQATQFSTQPVRTGVLTSAVYNDTLKVFVATHVYFDFSSENFTQALFTYFNQDNVDMMVYNTPSDCSSANETGLCPDFRPSNFTFPSEPVSNSTLIFSIQQIDVFSYALDFDSKIECKGSDQCLNGVCQSLCYPGQESDMVGIVPRIRADTDCI